MHDELEIRYALGCIKSMIEGGHRSMDLRKDVFDAFQQKLDDHLSRMVWMDPSAKSYYRNEHGRVAVWSPWLMKDYWRWTLKPDLEEYHLD